MTNRTDINEFLAKDDKEALSFDIDLCFPHASVFIKEDEQNGKFFWGIYDAEGTRIAVTDNRECAFAIARQNDFVPSSVH